MHIPDFYKYASFKQKYLTLRRDPFFDLASSYISSQAVVLDIGAGEGDFFTFLKTKRINIDNVYLLDGNEATVEKNKELTQKSIFYLAPDPLPFDTASVDLVHLSHLIDNLSNSDVYNFLKEVDRVLKPGGRIVISTPLLWPDFYSDLSHTRPYNPYIFFKYFVQQKRNNRQKEISNNYAIENLVYRYYEVPLDEGWSCTLPMIDILIISARRVLRNVGFKRLRKNGYTLILKKG